MSQLGQDGIETAFLQPLFVLAIIAVKIREKTEEFTLDQGLCIQSIMAAVLCLWWQEYKPADNTESAVRKQSRRSALVFNSCSSFYSAQDSMLCNNATTDMPLALFNR